MQTYLPISELSKSVYLQLVHGQKTLKTFRTGQKTTVKNLRDLDKLSTSRKQRSNQVDTINKVRQKQRYVNDRNHHRRSGPVPRCCNQIEQCVFLIETSQASLERHLLRRSSWCRVAIVVPHHSGL